MSNSRPNPATRFKQVSNVPMSKKAIGVRLPIDMDVVVRELAGDDLSNWIRQAIAEKLEREQQTV